MKRSFCSVAFLWMLATGVAGAQDPDFTARYRLTFEADWSATTHPMGFPPDPHFSGLIGATHDDFGYLWRLGETATDGIENMAETGGTSTLRNEVIDLIDAGAAGSVIQGGGISNSPGTRTIEFDIMQTHSLASVTTMIAPSPDWFVGVDSLSLRQDGQWRESVTVELPAIDAGTDSGPNYTSSNQDTNPKEPIAELTSGPWANGTPVGRFVFELLSVEGHYPIQGRHAGIYYNPVRDGEGLNIAIDSIGERRVITVIWYTYDQGGQMFLIGSAEFIQGDTEAVMDMVVTSGASFGDGFDPADVQVTAWGSLTVRFPTCKDVVIDYDGGSFGAGQLSMERLVGVQGLTCD